MLGMRNVPCASVETVLELGCNSIRAPERTAPAGSLILPVTEPLAPVTPLSATVIVLSGLGSAQVMREDACDETRGDTRIASRMNERARTLGISLLE
jgi:hypothetical protein